MDLRTAVTTAAFILITADICLSDNSTTLQPHNSVSSVSSSTPCTCLSSTSSASAPPITILGFLTINWTKTCEGDVILQNASFTLPVNFTKDISLLQHVCSQLKSCKGAPQWIKGMESPNCFHISENGARKIGSCHKLRVRCTVVPNVQAVPDIQVIQGQLQTYKVMTALLCCVLVVILVIRFTRPTVKALQNRLSDRRQNRWIGPTQSHSVSYHRGKTVKTNDEEKRLSYPALERLTVSGSREPSSNRNSGYNF